MHCSKDDFCDSGRFATKRKASDGAAGDERMALAIAEEHDGSDGAFLAGRKLVEYVNTAQHLPLPLGGKKVKMTIDRNQVKYQELSISKAAFNRLQQRYETEKNHALSWQRQGPDLTLTLKEYVVFFYQMFKNPLFLWSRPCTVLSENFLIML